MDTTSLLLLAAAALVLFIVLWRSLGKFRPRRDLPFTRCPSLLTDGELRFYRILLRAVPSGLVIFAKVRLLDLVTVPDSAWREYGAPASGMHVDFVMADIATLAPVLVIELDDKSHARPEAKKRDAFKNAAFASAGLPILRVKVGRYDEGELVKTLFEKISK